MIYVTCSAVIEDNQFVVRSVYVAGESESWLVTENNDWSPIKVSLDVNRLEAILHAQKYYSAPLVYSQIRVITDDDPKTFALFLRNKIKEGSGSQFHKRLYKILSNVGTEWKGKA